MPSPAKPVKKADATLVRPLCVAGTCSQRELARVHAVRCRQRPPLLKLLLARCSAAHHRCPLLRHASGLPLCLPPPFVSCSTSVSCRDPPPSRRSAARRLQADPHLTMSSSQAPSQVQMCP